MSFRFFDRRVRLFGNVAVVILCAIFFLVPFAMRGARKSVEKLENNIKDWLPADFPETSDLEWFGQHFVGERFVLVTWPGCTSADESFQLFVSKLKNEIQPPEPPEGATISEAEKARRMGDQLGLFATGDYSENWGGLGEKWLQGDNGTWYFISPAGELYRWDGDANVGDFVKRKIKKALGGEIATGELIAQFGSDASGQPNPYHADPRRLSARFFNGIRTGPMLLEEIAAEDGPLWPIGTEVADEDKPLVARQTAFERLTGTLFGPAVPAGFDWEADSFLDLLPDETEEALPFGWEERFASFVERLVTNEYAGDKSKLLAVSRTRQTEHWDALFTKLRVEAPPRQTCAIITLSEPGKRDLARVLGRPILGKPPGKLLALAHEVGVLPNLYGNVDPTETLQQRLENLKLGGPPVDNVAIDEEGAITLVRLVGFSAIIGISLSWLCFRSIKITIMVFFVGGVSAIAALALVFWSSAIPMMEHLASVDAVLMSMPALVYVLGLSGAVHIVNYYREAVQEQGVEGAAERALSHAWGPCTLAAFTTALGLISLFTSNLMPIKKFGLFSALGVMMTLLLLFLYLPSALTIWPFASAKREEKDGKDSISLTERIEAGWLAIGRWIVVRHRLVTGVCIVAMIAIGLGLTKIETEVQLLKLFDSGSKIIGDYRWLEDNLGRLVPMELVVKVKPEVIRPSLQRIGELKEEDPQAYRDSFFQLTLLERMELVDRIQKVCEREFGEDGRDIIGNGMSANTFIATLPEAADSSRGTFNSQLERRRTELPSDYVRTDTEDELWRVSERLAALSDVDFGEFLHRQKLAVEPILTAYRFRNSILRQLESKDEPGFERKKILLLGFPLEETAKDVPVSIDEAPQSATAAVAAHNEIDQTNIYSNTLRELLRAPGFVIGAVDPHCVRTRSSSSMLAIISLILLRPRPRLNSVIQSKSCIPVLYQSFTKPSELCCTAWSRASALPL
jgi:predicted RND superfamily exporter protein